MRKHHPLSPGCLPSLHLRNMYSAPEAVPILQGCEDAQRRGAPDTFPPQKIPSCLSVPGNEIWSIIFQRSRIFAVVSGERMSAKWPAARISFRKVNAAWRNRGSGQMHRTRPNRPSEVRSPGPSAAPPERTTAPDVAVHMAMHAADFLIICMPDLFKYIFVHGTVRPSPARPAFCLDSLKCS